MTEQFIYHYIPGRIQQLEYERYFIDFKDILLEPSVQGIEYDAFKFPPGAFYTNSPGVDVSIQKPSILEFTANNALYFVVGDPDGVIIKSDYGIYDSQYGVVNNQHEHRGKLSIENHDNEPKRIKFVVAVLVQ